MTRILYTYGLNHTKSCENNLCVILGKNFTRISGAELLKKLNLTIEGQFAMKQVIVSYDTFYCMSQFSMKENEEIKM